VTVLTEHVPRVPLEESVEVRDLGRGMHRLLVHTGFMQTPDLRCLLERVALDHHLPIDFGAVTYFIGRERLLATNEGEMKAMRERIFAFMARNAASPDVFYGLPPEHVIELGLLVDL
jgi:KUP system potassium uptake protein